MVDPIQETRNVSEIGAAGNFSQAAALSAANDRDHGKEPPARFQKLRHYISQMQGMILDTEA
jgi:hypothetical protein